MFTKCDRCSSPAIRNGRCPIHIPRSERGATEAELKLYDELVSGRHGKFEMLDGKATIEVIVARGCGDGETIEVHALGNPNLVWQRVRIDSILWHRGAYEYVLESTGMPVTVPEANVRKFEKIR